MFLISKYFDIKEFRKGIIILFSIIVLPFLFFIYKFVPDDKVWNNKLFILDSGFFNDAQYLIWFFCVKLMTLMILSIWFVTCMYKWRYVILFPILMELYKLYSIIKTWMLSISNELDVFEPLVISGLYILLLLLVSNRIKYYKFSKSINHKMNNEINNYLKKLSKFNIKYYKSVSQDFEELKTDKLNLDKKEYLIKLIKLRDKMTI